jgi:hypothetical protein
MNPGICHEEFACGDYLNSEKKKEIYCCKGGFKPFLAVISNDLVPMIQCLVSVIQR